MRDRARGHRSFTLLSLIAFGTLGAAAGVWACGSKEEGPPPGVDVEGGVVEGGELPEGAAFDGGGDATPPTATEACIAYLEAACARRVECGLPAANCLRFAAYCPDYLFAPGSSRTVDGVLACTAARKQQSCEELEVGIDPPCATPGTRQAGEACQFAGQCASMWCGFGGIGQCATCASIVPADAGCPGADQTCGQNRRCPSPQVGCVPIEVPMRLAPNAGCVMPGAPDAGTCPRAAPCAAVSASSPTGTCASPLPSSGPCLFAVGAATASLCAPGTSCLRVDPGLPNGECVPPGGKDALCGSGYGQRPCAEGFFCTDAIKGTCQPLHKSGESCQETTDCEPALYCNRTNVQALGACVPRAALGSTCGVVAIDAGVSLEIACEPSSVCTGTEVDGGFVNLCLRQGGTGADCSAPFTGCIAPLECKGGVCSLPTCVDAGPG